VLTDDAEKKALGISDVRAMARSGTPAGGDPA
jgi:hypothetical protein